MDSIFKSRYLAYSLAIILTLVSILIISENLLAPKISQQEQLYFKQQLNNLLPGLKYDNNVATSVININHPKYLEYLGKKNSTKSYIAKYQSSPTAIILPVTAPDGYSGDINLLVSVKLNNNNTKSHSIHKISVLQHNETPGLGDKIEPSKSNWLTQFTNKYINDDNTSKSPNKWQVKRDIDSITGATITSKAITNAVYKALLLIDEHPEILSETNNDH